MKNILTILGLLISSLVLAQPVRFQNITVNNGLSMGTITGFEKDAKGFVWIATAEGLHRYDGKHFKILKHIDGDSNALTDSYVTALLAHGNALYVGNHTGSIDVLDISSYNMHNLRIGDEFDYPITHIKAYKNQLLIGSLGGGLWKYDLDRLVLSQITLGAGQTTVTDILTHNDRCFVSTNQQVFQIEESGASPLAIQTERSITALGIHRHQLIIGTEKGLFQWNGDLNHLSPMPLPEKKRLVQYITSIASNNNTLWVGTHGGLLQYQGNDIQLHTYNSLRPYSLVNNKVSDLYLSNEDILWVGTIAGVSKYAPQLGKFGLLQYFDHQGVNYNNNVYFTYEDRSGTVWLGTLTSGIVRLNDRNGIDRVYPELRSNTVETRAVRSMLEDSKGRFWVGTRDEGLFLFNPETGSAQLVASKQNGEILDNTVFAIYEDRNKTLWIGTQSGLYYMADDGHFVHCKANDRSINNKVYQITQHPTKDELIIGSFRGGIQFYNYTTEEFRSLKHIDNDTNSLSNNNVMCLQWVNNDTLLIGTYGGGMNILDLETERFTHVSEKNGLINNSVYGILYEGNGYCWLSTNNGLARYNMYRHSFTHFKPVHYLQSTEYNEGAFLRSSKGTFYFGGVNGLNYFKPEDIQYNNQPAPLYYTDIRGKIENQNNDRLQLSFLNSRLEIDFMALHYSNPEGVKYRYKMSGYDNDWVEATASQTAVYPRLSPGSYTFSVVAEDEFGHWRSLSPDLKVYVKPPFWQQWYFIVLMVGLALGILYAIFRYRTRAIERTYKLQLVDSELAALRSQMNPHFIFNSLNSIQYFILKREPKEAYTYLSKFASLMRKILQNSRLKYLSVTDEMEWLNLYLEMERMRMDNILDYSIRCENIDRPDDVLIPTMLIQPFVENSIIHGLLPKDDNRKLEVIISKEEDHICCTITDNGIGREASRVMNEKRSSKHRSAGMDLTRKRLAILSEGQGHYDVQFEDLHENGEATGTVARVVIPMIRKTV